VYLGEPGCLGIQIFNTTYRVVLPTSRSISPESRSLVTLCFFDDLRRNPETSEVFCCRGKARPGAARTALRHFSLKPVGRKNRAGGFTCAKFRSDLTERRNPEAEVINKN